MSLQSRLSALITAIGADIKALQNQATSMGHDTAPIGAVIPWTRKTYPADYVLANGQRLSGATYPDAYNVAVAEVAAGNPLWTYRSSDNTFTVPDMTDKFVLSKGASRDVGATGGEETHLLTGPESGVQAHTHDTYGYDAPNVGTGGGIGYLRNLWNLGSATTGGVSGGAKNATTAHNNMPPYVVLAHIVKVRGVTVTAGVLQGPTGASGAVPLTSVEVWQSATNTPFSANTATPITWDFENDPNGMHAANSTKLYALQSGRHIISATVAISNGLGNLALRKNGNVNHTQWGDQGLNGQRVSGTFQVDLVVGEYVEILLWSSASGNTLPDANKANTWAYMTAMTGAKGDTGSVEDLTADEYDAINGPVTVVGDKFRWTRASNGAVILEEFAQLGDMGDGTFITEDYKHVKPVSSSRGGSMHLGVENGSNLSKVQMVDGGSGAGNPKRYIRAFVTKDSGSGVESRIIVASDGTSDFQKFIPVVTSLPSSGTDGQECYYRFSDAAGVPKYWHMKYDANEATAYKWKWIGGDPYYKKMGTNLTRTNTSAANVWADLATGVLSYTVPWQGDWEVEFGCTAMWNDTANSYAVMAVGIGAFAAPTDNTYVQGHYNGAAAGFTDYGPRGQKTMETVAQGDEIRIRYTRRAATGTANFQEPIWMSVRPVRGNRVLV